MKKLLLIAATSAAMLTSTSFADLENSFYVKANVGGLLLSKSNDKMTGIKMKAQTVDQTRGGGLDDNLWRFELSRRLTDPSFIFPSTLFYFASSQSSIKR